MVHEPFNVMACPQQTITSHELGLTLADAVSMNCDEEMDEADVISNCLVDEVAENQIYINKRMLVEVMQRYALMKQFRIKVVRLCTASLH